MKNKKLFAILTLVCFMFTLMPVAAFAAVDTADQVYIGTEKEATVMMSANGSATFNAVVSTDGSTTTTSGYAFYAVNKAGDGVAISNNGVLTVTAEGTYKVYAIQATQAISNYIDEVGYAKDKVAMLTGAYPGKIVSGYAEVTVKAPKFEYQVTVSNLAQNPDFTNVAAGTLTIAANNGFLNDGIVKVKVERRTPADVANNIAAGNWEPVKGQEVSFAKAGYVNVTAVDGITKTDKNGEMKVAITSGNAGNGYKVIAKYEKAKAEITVNVNPIAVDEIAVYAAPKAPVNIDNSVEAAGVEFKVTDASGAPYTFTDTNGTVDDGQAVIRLIEKPADSNMEADDFDLEVDADQIPGVYELVATTSFDEEGKYVVRVSLENGASATATIEVAEMGDVVGIQFVKAPVSVTLGGNVDFDRVVAVDAKGVTDNTLVLGTDVMLSANGAAVDEFDVNNNVYTLVAKDKETYVGSTITVLAKYGDFVATTEVTVVDEAMSIAYKNTEVAVGVNTTLIANVVDANGDVTTVNGVNNPVDVIVIDKPENAIAVASGNYDTQKQQLNVSFLASAAGEYKVQTIITYDVTDANNNVATKYISSIETITVGAKADEFKDVVVISMGADKMIVNSEVVALDVAPFIENNRTMMQYNVLYVFGIDVQWDGVNSVIAEGNGIKVVMTIGSKVATVNGEEVALDVAPYVVNGRTVVPVGFITGLLDITPVFTYNADGSIADILFAK